jgi:hypothetical protein
MAKRITTSRLTPEVLAALRADSKRTARTVSFLVNQILEWHYFGQRM